MGQLGDGSSENRNVPTQVGTDTDWVSIVAGFVHNCGIRDDGSRPSLWCWGNNEYGQLGDGISLDPRQAGTDTDWVSVTAGGDHSCGLRDNGSGFSLWSWGRNNHGQLGNGGIEDKNVPTQAGTDTDWVSLAAGSDHSCGLRDDGSGPSLWCWGYNEYGQLGDGSTETKNVPTQVGTDTDWVSLAASGNHSCGIREDGSGHLLWCWGDGTEVPIQVGTYSDWVSIAVGSGYSCGLRDDGSGPSLWCWGSGTSVPTQVGMATDWITISLVGSFEDHICGIRDDGSGPSLWCWESAITAPTQVGTDNDWVTVAVGLCPRCGIRNDDAGSSLWCWGSTTSCHNNSNGFPFKYEEEPTQVGTYADWVTVAVGHYHSCGIRDDGSGSSLWCRGEDLHGQLGDGVPHREEPNQVHW